MVLGGASGSRPARARDDLGCAARQRARARVRASAALSSRGVTPFSVFASSQGKAPVTPFFHRAAADAATARAEPRVARPFRTGVNPSYSLLARRRYARAGSAE